MNVRGPVWAATGERPRQARILFRKETCMPFTLAHPAAVIPLRRVLGRASVLSALIIGSLSPDVIYFIPLGIGRATSHSLAGLFWFCIPVGFVGYLLFHALLRPIGYYLLPRGSTLAGLSLLTLWGWQWFIATKAHHEPRGGQPLEAVRVPALLVLLAASALGGLLSGVWHMSAAAGMKALQQFVRHGVITAMGVFGTILLGLGVLWRLWEARVESKPNRR